MDGEAGGASPLLVCSWARGGSYSSFTSACHLLGTLEVLVEGQEEDLKNRISWDWSGSGTEMREAACPSDDEPAACEWRLLLRASLSPAFTCCLHLS